MKSLVKMAMILVGLALILIAILAIVAGTQLEKVAKAGIERSLSHVFLTEATVAEVNVVPMKRRFEILGLTVNNPAAFKTGPAMEFERIELELDIKTLFSGAPTIDRILIKNPRMNLRFELAEGTNLGMLAKHASRFSEGKEQPPADKPSRGYAIRELRCEGAKVALSTNLMPGQEVKVDVAPFALQDIGDQKSITTAEVSAIFIRTLLRETLGAKGLLRPVAELLRKESEGAGVKSKGPGTVDKPAPSP